MEDNKKSIAGLQERIDELKGTVRELAEQKKRLIAEYLKEFLSGCKGGKFDFSNLMEEQDFEGCRVYHDVYDRRGECSYSGYIFAVAADGGDITVEAKDDHGYGVEESSRLEWLDHETAGELYGLIEDMKEAQAKGNVKFDSTGTFTQALYPEED